METRNSFVVRDKRNGLYIVYMERRSHVGVRKEVAWTDNIYQAVCFEAGLKIRTIANLAHAELTDLELIPVVVTTTVEVDCKPL